MKVLGFPELNLELVERERIIGLGGQGNVKCWIHPLPSTTGPDGKVKCHFLLLNLDRYNRGKVIKIDITVLAPDNKGSWLISGTGKKKKKKKKRPLQSSAKGSKASHQNSSSQTSLLRFTPLNEAIISRTSTSSL